MLFNTEMKVLIKIRVIEVLIKLNKMQSIPDGVIKVWSYAMTTMGEGGRVLIILWKWEGVT